MKPLRLYFLLAQLCVAVLAQYITPEEFNAPIIGDVKGRPEGHRTVPYMEGLLDPYKKFADEADPIEILGE